LTAEDCSASLAAIVRLPIALIVVAALRVSAVADCPGSGCIGGGTGPASTDCFVAWSGLPSLTATCTDGDPCDADGKADGICTFPLRACIAMTDIAGCNPGALDGAATVKPTNSPTAQQLGSALAALGTTGPACTPSGVTVPVKAVVAGLKPGKVRLTVTAASGGKRDHDKLNLTCLPSTVAPSFANAVQPIFTNKCAYSGGCHDSAFRAGANGSRPGQVLEAGVAYGDAVGVVSSESPHFLRVKPRSIKDSFMARKILGLGLVPQPIAGVEMPQGCPGGPIPMGGCLSQDEKFTLLYWIANGAPNN
jgi:hypothetical protein